MRRAILAALTASGLMALASAPAEAPVPSAVAAASAAVAASAPVADITPVVVPPSEPVKTVEVPAKGRDKTAAAGPAPAPVAKPAKAEAKRLYQADPSGARSGLWLWRRDHRFSLKWTASSGSMVMDS